MLGYENKVYKVEKAVINVELELFDDLKKAILEVNTNEYGDEFYEVDEILKALSHLYKKVLNYEEVKTENIIEMIYDDFKEELELADVEEVRILVDKTVNHIQENEEMKQQGILV
jgi:hypothetical protein